MWDNTPLFCIVTCQRWACGRRTIVQSRSDTRMKRWGCVSTLLAMAVVLVALAGALLWNMLVLLAMQGPLFCSAGRERLISISRRVCSSSVTDLNTLCW